ncbi:GntR family transcriptional regulator [Kitasatospora paracochleata]|uniref:GntR family transcriptional regulator n=1 Tax=Kitasatospora paracochleata TaxID=58354 RepID=UPI00389931B4
MAAGAKIPTETESAETYGVSRPTVCLSVAALRAEGLLDVTQGRGTGWRIRTAAGRRRPFPQACVACSSSPGRRHDRHRSVGRAG